MVRILYVNIPFVLTILRTRVNILLRQRGGVAIFQTELLLFWHFDEMAAIPPGSQLRDTQRYPRSLAIRRASKAAPGTPFPQTYIINAVMVLYLSLFDSTV